MSKGDVNGTARKTAGRFEHVNGSRDRLMRMVVDVDGCIIHCAGPCWWRFQLLIGLFYLERMGVCAGLVEPVVVAVVDSSEVNNELN